MTKSRENDAEPSPALCFRAWIDIRGINPYVLVSARQASGLKPNWRKPMPVRIQVNDKPDVPWQVNLMPAGDGSFYLYLAQPVRLASGTKVGDRVRIRIAFDARYRGGPAHPLPSWFKKRLDRNRVAMANWSRLPPSRQKEILRYFAGLKSQEARTRNVERALAVLSGARERFMARDWNS